MEKDDFKSLCLKYGGELICLHEAIGTYIEVSPSIEKIAGYTPQELVGKNPYDYFHDEDKEYIEKTGHLPSLRGKSDTVTVYRFRKKDGTFIWFESETIPLKDEEENITNVLTITKDITEVKSKLDFLYKEEVLWEETGRLAKLGAWELDLETMTPIWSKTTYDIHEVPYDQQPVLEEAINFYAEEARPVIEKLVQEAIEFGKPWDKQLPFITAKRNKIWVRTIGRPEIRLGKTIKLYGIFQDVTKEIETRNQQKELIDQLTSQKKQLQEFNQIVSHNLRSPISSLNTLLHFFDEADDDEEKEEIVDNIKQASNSLNALLEDLVEAVKIISDDSVEYEMVNIEHVVEKTKQLLKGTIKELNAEITLDTTAWEEIKYPKLYFESIILNLLSNALKYHSTERAPKVKIITTIEDNKKVLKISDNGLGINLKRYGEKVFKLHKTFHRNRPGKGLGLFMTKNQVEATGSKISIESEEGKGTTFTIIFKK